VSDEALELAQMERVLAVREHQAAQAREAAARAELQAARAGVVDADPQQPGRAVTEVRAPAAGRVLHVAERSEHIAAAGTPLVEVGDAAGLEVVVDVLSTDAVTIAPGAPVRLVEWGGEGALDARVVRVEPSAFTRVSALGVEEQRVLVVAALAEAPSGLGDGYRVEARIVTWAADDVVRVPTSALFRDGAVWGVFVVEAGRARRRVVEIGRRSASDAQVVRGLVPGDRVILFPSDRIADGARVR
jgi:HlyD family secretion protein